MFFGLQLFCDQHMVSSNCFVANVFFVTSCVDNMASGHQLFCDQHMVSGYQLFCGLHGFVLQLFCGQHGFWGSLMRYRLALQGKG